MHIPLEHTHRHTTWPTTTYSHKYTSKLQFLQNLNMWFWLQQENVGKVLNDEWHEGNKVL